MDWRDEGILLDLRRHGESAAIIEVLTQAHGRHAGVVRGGGGRRMAPVLQPGAQLDLSWRARLSDHIGTFVVDPVRNRSGALLSDAAALAALSSVCAILMQVLPERDPQPAIYARSLALLDSLSSDAEWPLAYLWWERLLLEDTGFGLDLTRCAVTGATEGLSHVSPRTGRAVSAAGAGAWVARLLPLPDCLRTGQGGDPADWVAGLAVTGHFLEHALLAETGGTLPEARRRLAAALSRRAGAGVSSSSP
jgi:DNA repair protein RecO (recombination protein O)